MKKNELLRVAIAFFAVAVITLGVHEYRSSGASASDFPARSITASEVLIDVSIAEGSTGSEIAAQLLDLGIIESSQSFFRVAVSDARAARIAPGIHQLNSKISAKQALEQLLDSGRIPNLIKVFEGQWSTEIFKELEQNGFAKTDVLKAAKEIQLPKGFTSLEGVLFPAQYSFTKETSSKQALESMIKRFEQQVATLGLSGHPKFSPQELIVIASINA